MKRNLIALSFILMILSVFAQSPQKMSYQAVIRDASNNLVREASVGMRISVLQGSASGTATYVEDHMPTTSSAGVVSLEIGAGTVVSGDFSSIDWSDGPYFVQTETDPSGGTSYSITVTSQLLSVPYALYAENTGYTETDPLFDVSVAKGITSADTLKWNNSGSSNAITQVYDNDFKIINSSGIAGNPLAAANTFLAGFGAGNVDNGTHDYVVTYVTSAGETGAGPASGSVTVSDNSSNGQVLLTNLPVSSDGSVTARNIYRRFDGSGTYYYLTTINDNSTASYIDNIGNASLGGSLPGNNSTERSIQFLASGLSGNRTYTLPDVSGKLVIDDGEVSVKTVADRSMINHGRAVVQDLINGSYIFSADGGEWGEAYVDSNGRNNSVLTGNSFATFSSNQYESYTFPTSFVLLKASSIDQNIFTSNNCTIIPIDTGKWVLTANGSTEGEIEGRIANTLFVRNLAGNSSMPSTSGALIHSGTLGLNRLSTSITSWIDKRGIYAYGGNPPNSESSYYLGTFTNANENLSVSSWSYCVSNVDGSVNEFNTDRNADIIDNPASCRLFTEEVGGTHYSEWSIPSGSWKNIGTSGSGGSWWVEALIISQQLIDWTVTGNGSFNDIDFTRDYNIPIFQNFVLSIDNPEDIIVHNIPSGKFSSSINSVLTTFLISEWEEGASVKYKLQNNSEDSGWLNYNEVAEFTPFTSEPNKLIIKLIPKADNPTPGVPAISGFYITEL